MLPSSIEKRQLLNAYIEEAVGLLRLKDNIDLKLKDIKDAVKDSFKDYDIKFNDMVKCRYDKDKVVEAVDKLETVLNEDEILLNTLMSNTLGDAILRNDSDAIMDE